MIIRQGDRGQQVKDIQNVLNLYVFGAVQPLAIDGIFGPKTFSAVRTFQAKAGVKDDGIVGPATAFALFSAVLKRDEFGKVTVLHEERKKRGG